MRLLVIGLPERQALLKLDERAKARIVDAKAAMRDDPAAQRKANNAQTIELPQGFAVTLTYERQPAGLCRHVSVSVDKPRKLPTPEAVNMILAELGMASLDKAIAVWIETVSPSLSAVNILHLAMEERT